MAFLIMFLVWYNLWGKSNPKIYRALEDKIGKIIFAFIVFSMVSSAIPSFLVTTMVGLIILLITFSPFIAIFWILSRLLGKKRREQAKDNYTYSGGNASKGYANYAEYDSKNRRGASLTGLTKSVPKRRKIVSRFNRKYNLTLTDKEIDRIVDASYMSYAWEREIFDMQNEYDSIYQWYNTDTCWLRAYLRTFSVQSVSADFEMQRKICLNSFEQIFNEIQPGSYANIDDCIDAINNRYLTCFDESTFMMAYRFLEMNGKKYDLPNFGILKNESDLDRLKRKYDEDSVETSTPAGTRGTV